MATIGPIQNLYNLRMAGALPPAQGGGLSAMFPPEQPLPTSQSADPIQSGIDTLMAYGRQATGQNAGLASMIGPTGAPMMARGGRVLRFMDGGMADDGIGTSETEAAGSTSGGESMASGVGGPGDYSYSGNEYGPTTQAAVDAVMGVVGDPMGVFGSTKTPDLQNFAKAQDFANSFLGKAINALTPFSVAPNPMTMGLNVGVSPAALVGMAVGLPGLGVLGNMLGIPDISLTQSVPGKGTSGTTEGTDGIDDGDSSQIDYRTAYGDPYNTPRKVEEEAVSEEPDTFFRRTARMPLTLSDIVGYASGQPGYEGGFPSFLPAVTAAQGGGISALAYGGDTAPAGYGNPSFEGMVPGQGSGMSDSVPFSIEGQQPALLSRDEYVLPADVVSQLGDGSSGAGADMLDSFVSQVRQAKYGNTQQPPAVGGGLMSALMRHGGLI